MNKYVERVIADVKKQYADQPEFVQTVEEVFSSVSPLIDAHPEYEENAILERMVIPERVVMFRVPWEDDKGDMHVNTGYRVQYSSAIGPYKGGLRFAPNVNISIIKFLGFEQVFKDALSTLPIGGAKGGLKIAIQNHLLNDDIRESEVRLISEEGEQLGVMSSEQALQIAEERELDLVLISPQAKPPVCRIMDYGKYRFEQTKKEKEARKNQRIIEVKEIRMSPGIGENDFNTKLKNGQKFLLDGDRLKVTVRFRGREMAHTHIGEELLTDFAAKCAEIATLDKNPKLEGRNMFMFLSPKAPDKAKKSKGDNS
jgi:translation initiation factor IF-3